MRSSARTSARSSTSWTWTTASAAHSPTCSPHWPGGVRSTELHPPRTSGTYLPAGPPTTGSPAHRSPTPSSGRAPPLAVAYAAPSTDLERLLTTVWQQVLGLDEIGVHDNFFELGGSSLQAGQVLTRLRTTFPIDIRFDLFFGNPTIAGLAPLVEDCLVAHLAELTDDEAEQLLESVSSLSGDA
ncbi:phosphopantetheine-binding protein [Pseudonocardia spinosispora]|uniref:phosphopantetheine-binding protein n=1 Tax=Pseudonocardia spinosispora TaxID=103441 RepID=UPI003CCBE108